MKKVVVFGSVFLLMCLVIIFFLNFGNISLEIYLNNGISILNPSNVDIIYTYEFGEGEDFYILSYDNDENVKRIIKKNEFQKISENNIEKITKILNMYRADLCEKELELFDKTTNISELSKIGNYYLYKEDIEDDEDYFICIISPIDKKVFYFNINH